MAAKAVIWFFQIFLISAVAQKLRSGPYSTHGICKTIDCKRSITCLKSLADCVVIVGNLQIYSFEKSTRDQFKNISFPKLREVTGYFVAYRIQGLESLGSLFPNLARIRGEQSINNYTLIVFDMPSLIEVGLYSLIKIDRGDVKVQESPHACYLNTVNWNTIAPGSRHTIDSHDTQSPPCNNLCNCSENASVNYCWNDRKCQRFIDEPEREKCHEQCLGCLNNNEKECSVCRYYTHEDKCVSHCPNGTLDIKANQYCITISECSTLGGWAWNGSCVFNCPIDYVEEKTATGITCNFCADCYHTCPDQIIQTIGAIQAAEKCVYINGSLTIHIRGISEAMKLLKSYLSQIKEVSDYVLISGSNVITSLDFLPSLRYIKGQNLKNDRYSLIINDMINLHTAFDANVTKHLKIDRGTLNVFNNPMLCMSDVDKLKHLFPQQPNEKDIPAGTNGYIVGCEEVPVDIKVNVLNETSAVIMFAPITDSKVHYSVLYVRLPPGFNGSVISETCSETDWFVISVPDGFGQNGTVELTSLRPASTYAFCIEIFDSVHQHISRSSIFNFSTPVGVPEPPFLIELLAYSYDTVILHWVDHNDYKPHITRYELDVFLINSDYTVSIDHCKYTVNNIKNVDYSRHAVVMRPPPEYGKYCESMCGILANFTAGTFVEENFDVCSEIENGCTSQEEIPPSNVSFGNYIGTLALNITSPKSDYHVANLAPFRDYRFRLRACYVNVCSRSTRGVVRTLQSPKADVPTLISVFADDIGHITVKWKSPNETNGPILAYTVKVLPNLNNSDLVIPQAWCLAANITTFVALSVAAAEYRVSVCSTTLASQSTCCEWVSIEPTKMTTTLRSTWWWVGFLFAFFICPFSILIGILYKPQRAANDIAPLVEGVSITNSQSEPPSSLRVEFMPLYLLRTNERTLEE